METALAQELPYLRQELTRTVGLGNKVITSSGSRFCLVATQSIRGDRDDWNVRERWIGLDAARRLVAIHDRKLDIHRSGRCFAATVTASSPFSASIIS